MNRYGLTAVPIINAPLIVAILIPLCNRLLMHITLIKFMLACIYVFVVESKLSSLNYINRKGAKLEAEI